jgi:uncharacterized protein (DUF433 family)
MIAAIGKPLVDHIEPLDPERLKGDLIQPGHPLFGLIWINRARVSGEPCFYATRVPVTTLFDCLAAGQTLDEFFEDFEGVTAEQVNAVLELAKNGLLADLPSSTACRTRCRRSSRSRRSCWTCSDRR